MRNVKQEPHTMMWGIKRFAHFRPLTWRKECSLWAFVRAPEFCEVNPPEKAHNSVGIFFETQEGGRHDRRNCPHTCIVLHRGSKNINVYTSFMFCFFLPCAQLHRHGPWL